MLMSPNSLTRYEENADKDKGMHNESRKKTLDIYLNGVLHYTQIKVRAEILTAVRQVDGWPLISHP